MIAVAKRTPQKRGKRPQTARTAKTRVVGHPTPTKSTPTPRPAPALSRNEARARAATAAGYEECRCKCGEMVDQDGGGAARRYYVDETHAFRAYCERNGWKSAYLASLETAKAEALAARATRTKPVPPKRGPLDPDTAERLERRYGPLRTIKAVVGTPTATSKRVTMVECAHEITVSASATAPRCRPCRERKD